MKSSLKLVILGFLFCISSTYSNPSIERELRNQKKALEELKKTLKEEQKALERLIINKDNALGQVEQINENIRLTNEYLEQLEQTAVLLLRSLEEKKRSLKSSREAMQLHEEWIIKRTRRLYITQNKEGLFTYLFTEGKSNWMKRFFFMQRMVSYDQSLLKIAEKEKKEYQEAVLELEIKQKDIEMFQKKKNNEVEEHQGDLKRMQAKIIAFETDETSKRKILEEMQENSKALANIIKKLEKRRRSALISDGPRILNKEGLFCEPTKGPIISQYGVQYHKKLKTSTRNLGVEYLGQVGNPIVSAAAGEVVYVNRIPGYGNGLILYHGSGYYSIYGNLEAIQVREDDTVLGCEVLTKVPHNRGKASRKVYFEVRKERNSIDPVKWVRTMIN